MTTAQQKAFEEWALGSSTPPSYGSHKAGWQAAVQWMSEEFLRDLLEEAEASIKQQYCHEPDGSCHPALQHKYERDMVCVNKAKAAIEKVTNDISY